MATRSIRRRLILTMVLAQALLAAGLLFCACSIALSRILLGLHFLSDVLAGAAIGALLGYASYSLLP